MMRALAPYLLISALVAGGMGVAYAKGAPVWSVYLAVIVGVLIPLPAYIRWDKRHYP